MNIIRLKADYARVRGRAIEGIVSTEIDPRCHEMAFLINCGLKHKYNSFVEDVSAFLKGGNIRGLE